jgi:hypothetical protein
VIYLVSPYSHPDPLVREERFQAACEATADLIRSGAIVYSPIRPLPSARGPRPTNQLGILGAARPLASGAV